MLGLHGQIQRRNAALALILSKAFLKATCPELLPGYDVQSPVASQQLLEGSGDIDTVLPFQISGSYFYSSLKNAFFCHKVRKIYDVKRLVLEPLDCVCLFFL